MLICPLISYPLNLNEFYYQGTSILIKWTQLYEETFSENQPLNTCTGSFLFYPTKQNRVKQFELNFMESKDWKGQSEQYRTNNSVFFPNFFRQTFLRDIYTEHQASNWSRLVSKLVSLFKLSSNIPQLVGAQKYILFCDKKGNYCVDCSNYGKWWWSILHCISHNLATQISCNAKLK